MYKRDYEHKLNNQVLNHSEKRELDRIIDEKNWPKMIREEIIWFRFQCVMGHAAHHTK